MNIIECKMLKFNGNINQMLFIDIADINSDSINLLLKVVVYILNWDIYD